MNTPIYFKDYNQQKGSYEKNLGSLKAERPVTVLFEKTQDCKPIKSLSASCGCTEPKELPEGIEVKFTPYSGVVSVTKVVWVTFQDGSQVTLSIKGTVEA